MKELGKNDPLVLELRAAEQKHRELRRRKISLEASIEEQLEKLRSLRAQSRIDREADAVLLGTEAETVSIKELGDLRHDVEVLNRALEKQEEIVNLTRNKFSRALCALNRGEYVDVQRKIVAAVDLLAKANEAEARFFDQLRDAGCTHINFRPMAIATIGTLNDPNSRASLHRREVREYCAEALT